MPEPRPYNSEPQRAGAAVGGVWRAIWAIRGSFTRHGLRMRWKRWYFALELSRSAVSSCLNTLASTFASVLVDLLPWHGFNS